MIRSVAILVLVVAAPAVADVLPLAHGTWVDAGTPCADPPFAVMRTYDGRGFGSAHSRDCRARVVSRRGTRFKLTNDCIGAGEGPAPRTVERLDIRVRSRTRMSFNGSAFRLCPRTGLPASLRSSAG